MKLYEVRRNTRVRVPELEIEVMFHHIDGMYSVCTYGTDVVHLAAWTEVEIAEDREPVCTGWHHDMAQETSRDLSRWLANTPEAMRCAREAAADIATSLKENRP